MSRHGARVPALALVMVLCASAGWTQAPRRTAARTVSAGGADAPALAVDQARRTARLAVRAGAPSTTQPELNFNGTAMGDMELRVPLGWTVELAFSNLGQAPHSIRLVRDAELPVQIGPAVIAGVETPHAEQGHTPGSTHLVVFRATRAGRYRVSCAVPAHGYTGMWFHLRVVPALARPALSHRDVAQRPPSAGGTH
jgi:uncharacterized cupredoxin-like copper-binding protein